MGRFVDSQRVDRGPALYAVLYARSAVVLAPTTRRSPHVPRRAESSVRKEADKLAQAVETAAEEVKPVAEAAPKKKKGFSPFKGFGKKKEA